MSSWVFDDMGGRFDARLRKVFPMTRSAKNGDREIVVTNVVAAVEAKFDFATLDRLYSPNFIAVERPTDGKTTYLIFEVVGVNPIHFQMLGMDISMPTILRREYLDTISESWGKSQETWIDLSAVPTWYSLSLDGEEAGFKRSRLLPLAGARAFMLSRRAVERFLCYEGGEPIGEMIGFGMPLTVNLENLIRFHTGVFGFTGSGKSNLTSVLLRKVMRAYNDITAIVFDVSGEYTTHLVDLVETDGRLYSSEAIENDQQLYNSQVIPESLEESVSESRVRQVFSKILDDGRFKQLSVGSGSSALNLGALEDLLTKTAEEGKSGAVAARIAMERLSRLFSGLRLQRSTKLLELRDEPRKALLDLLEGVREKTNERTSLRSEVEAMIEYMSLDQGEETVDPGGLTPEQLAWNVASEAVPRLNILYLPEPADARMVANRLITRLLNLRKKQGSRKKILVVLDEAQEYISDNPRDRDNTLGSNLAVEALLRQGRKYRVHCWLATQRVARLNVSALQQLHSYFVSTLPRFYDRMVIADSFALPYEVLERTAQLDTGEWIFVSYKATRQKNVPVFIRTENNEDIVAGHFKA